MKNITNFIFEQSSKKSIFEKLKLNSQSKLKPNDWTIKDAKLGDIITIQYSSIKITYMFRNIYKTIEWGDAVHVCGYYHYKENMFFAVQESNGSIMGTVKEYFDDSMKYWKATPQERDKFFKAASKAGYKWNPAKNEFEYI